jgi:CheY-like chemotaxis protein
LCVDDEPAGLAVRKIILELAGYTVLTATSGEEAVSVISGTHLDLLITDQLLPSMSGAQLAAEAKRLCPALKVLILSGLFDPPDLTHADGFFFKLDGPTALLEKVAAVLKPEALKVMGASAS